MKIAAMIFSGLVSLPVFAAGGVSQGGPTANFGFQVSCTSADQSLTLAASGFFNGEATVTSDFTAMPLPSTVNVGGTYDSNGILNMVSLTSSSGLAAEMDITVPDTFAYGQLSFQGPGVLTYSAGGQQTTIDFSCDFSKN